MPACVGIRVLLYSCYPLAKRFLSLTDLYDKAARYLVIKIKSFLLHGNTPPINRIKCSDMVACVILPVAN